MADADGSKTQFEYDANGFRTQKRQYGADGRLEYYVDYIWLDGKLTQQSMTLMAYRLDGTSYGIGPINAKFVYEDNSQQPQSCLLDGVALLFVRNLQGDVVAVVNGDGNIWAEFTYDAWGNVEVTSPLEDESIREVALKMLPLLCPLTYRGYNYDFTTGLYYLQSRYYNPEWGRFLNCDDTSILLSTQGTTHGANLFAYCENNPVSKVDYTGRYSVELEYDLLGLSLWVASLSVTYKILARIEGYRDYLEYDLCGFTYRILEDKFIIFDRCPYIITNIAFHDSQNKKYYVIKTVISDMSYWYQRERNVKEMVNDNLNKHASVFVEGSLMEIIDDYDDVPMGEGVKNLVGDGINYGIARALIEVMYPMPLQFRSVYDRNRGASLIIGLTKSVVRLKSSVYACLFDLSLPSIYDDVEAIY